MAGIFQVLHIYLREQSVPPQCAKGLGLALRRRGGRRVSVLVLPLCDLIEVSLGRAQVFSFPSVLREACITQGHKGRDHFYLEILQMWEKEIKIETRKLL